MAHMAIHGDIPWTKLSHSQDKTANTFQRIYTESDVGRSLQMTVLWSPLGGETADILVLNYHTSTD